jgi:transposase-like protein
MSHFVGMRELDAELWAKWRGLVSEQQASGQSVSAFCHARGMTSSQLFAWKKRLREAEKAKFVEVQVTPHEEPHHPGTTPERGRTIEIRLIRGCSLVVEPGFDADHLRALLAVLEAEG